ncbi:hypothetical protein Goshw_005111 [Gossypium schwendimanii]|uniref:HAT C-terminal dimerisation domain-containing protein n=1 Tax=Gossypium schwendimanii TaxID=34291 RepID=A0A7J9NER8_GOSSC|nr:hypothetical protein [Gossypium schwendimanii]
MDKDYQINEEWRNVAILCNFLKVFYDVTCVFFGSNYPMANLYFRGVWKVHKVLLETVKGPHSFLTPMVKQMQEKFNKYWTEYSLILSCAAILDPHYKLNYVQYCFTTIYGIHASDFVQTILRNLRIWFDEYVKKSKSTFSSLTGSSNILDNNPVDPSLHQHNVNNAHFGGDYDDSDGYKRKSSVRYNELSLLARDLFTIPILTIASESAFSMGKKVITPFKSSLNLKTVQAIVCFDDWMPAKGFSKEIGFKNNDDDDDNEDNVSPIAF